MLRVILPKRSCVRLSHWVQAELMAMSTALANVAELLDATAGTCVACAETRRTCPSCVQRRRRAWLLVSEEGETVETAARVMGLSFVRVRELLAEEADRRELRNLRCDSIPVALTRSAVEDALARDPDLTIGEIAHWLDMRQADFERAFLGRTRDGRPKRRVSVGLTVVPPEPKVVSRVPSGI